MIRLDRKGWVEMRFERYIGWIIVVAVLAVFCVSWAFDSAAAARTGLEARVSPNTIPADGLTSTRLIARALNPDGSVRVGDVIEVQSLRGGTFDRFRTLSDQNGEAEFVFISSRSNKYRPAAPVSVIVTNFSLGHLIEVRRSTTVTINVIEPKPEKGPNGPSQ